MLILRKTLVKGREQDVQGQVFVCLFPLFSIVLRKKKRADSTQMNRGEWQGSTLQLLRSFWWRLAFGRITCLELAETLWARESQDVEGEAPEQIFPPQRSHQLVTQGNGETEIKERKLGVGCDGESSECGGWWWWNQDNGQDVTRWEGGQPPEGNGANGSNFRALSQEHILCSWIWLKISALPSLPVWHWTVDLISWSLNLLPASQASFEN